MPLPNIHQFEDMLSEMLWQLDTRAFALASKGNDPEAYLSDDGFLYDRCCVVANGKAFFETVLRDPQQFPVGVSFEALLYVAGDAYRRKTRARFSAHPDLQLRDWQQYGGLVNSPFLIMPHGSLDSIRCSNPDGPESRGEKRRKKLKMNTLKRSRGIRAAVSR